MVARRCGCAGDFCSCRFKAGPGMIMEGVGDPNLPLTLIVGDTQTKISVIDTPTMDLSIAGDGTPGRAYTITGSKIDSSADNVIAKQYFYADGVWVKPLTANFVEVFVIAGGGGGQAGGAYPIPYGGIPGGGGGFSSKMFLASDLPTSVPITVGLGGNGGVTSSQWGVVGGDSSFGTFLNALGGHPSDLNYQDTINAMNSNTDIKTVPWGIGTEQGQFCNGGWPSVQNRVPKIFHGRGGGVGGFADGLNGFSNVGTLIATDGGGVSPVMFAHGRGGNAGHYVADIKCDTCIDGQPGEDGAQRQGSAEIISTISAGGGGGGAKSPDPTYNNTSNGGNGGNGGFPGGGGGAGAGSGSVGPSRLGGNGGNGGDGLVVIRVY